MARYKVYRPIRRRARRVPWGYKVSDTDPKLLEPIPEMLKLLDVAERAWKTGTSSHNQIAAWLTVQSGVPITRAGLKQRIEIYGPKMRRRGVKDSDCEARPPA
jgi:hypothetical protein